MKARTDTTSITGSYGFNAPPEVVFGVLTDPDRAARWLPGPGQVVAASTERVRIADGQRSRDYGVEIAADELRVLWRSLDSGGAHGVARVEDAPGGGSVVHAEVTAPDGDEKTVTDLLDEAMGGLRSEVSDNFNAG
ncbi:SRPBCC family protein [Actinoplanes sp. NEAU-A12]|uniref:SRPBCC family protein n=1 Tax=Actinoplanes sandaracinus TaxID=3045177 RepID=A0ABT6WIE9_9ACTN|nr:SRPBCC family protein [Actinoplanes sandaracinus]MDI6099512.1 SRPBCC family protein [Actinoplanes sandaracinus]